MDWRDKDQRAVFLTALKVMADVYDKTVPADKAKAYFAALGDLNVDDVARAMALATRDATADSFFPRPGDIRARIEGTPETRANVEAGKVYRAICEHGGYSSVVFDDAVTSAVVLHGMGGWAVLCANTREGGEMWFRRDFVQRYLEFAVSGVRHDGIHYGSGLPDKPRPLAVVGDGGNARVKALCAAYMPRRVLTGGPAKITFSSLIKAADNRIGTGGGDAL